MLLGRAPKTIRTDSECGRPKNGRMVRIANGWHIIVPIIDIGSKLLPEHIQHRRTVRIICPKKNTVRIATPHSPNTLSRRCPLVSLLRQFVQIPHRLLLRVPAGIGLKPLLLTRLSHPHLLLVRRRELRQRQLLKAGKCRTSRQTRRELIIVEQSLLGLSVSPSYGLRDEPHALGVKPARRSHLGRRHVDAVVQVAQHECKTSSRVVCHHRLDKLAGVDESRHDLLRVVVAASEL